MKANVALYPLLASVLWSPAGPLRAQEDRIYWHSNYNEALQEARRTQKPIFLEFRCEA